MVGLATLQICEMTLAKHLILLLQLDFNEPGELFESVVILEIMSGSR